MDARKMSLSSIKEGIKGGNYEITGVLETGEIVISLVTELDKAYLSTVLDKDNPNEKLTLLKELIRTKGRPAEELLQVYKQNVCDKTQRCVKNSLRLRRELIRNKKDIKAELDEEQCKPFLTPLGTKIYKNK